MPHISVVVPVYNEEASTLSEFVLQLKTALAAITDDFELILVDDGSQNDAWVSIVSLSRADRRVMGIRFTRNFGQHAAIAAGIDHANGDWVVVMDRSDTLTYSGVISGTGSLTQAGTGTTILTGANTYTGATNVNAGTLQAGANTTFAQNSAFTIAAGATLALNNFNETIGSLAGAGTVTNGALPAEPSRPAATTHRRRFQA